MNDTKPKNKHLQYEDRAKIEASLDIGLNPLKIANTFNYDLSLVTREISNRRFEVLPSSFNEGKSSINVRLCSRDRKSCIYRRVDETKERLVCPDNCKHHLEKRCEKLTRLSSVCNSCEKKHACRKRKYYYRALEAQTAYEKELKEARGKRYIQNINMDLLRYLLIDQVVNKGHSVEVFLDNNKEFRLSASTLRRWIEKRYFPQISSSSLRNSIKFSKKEYVRPYPKPHHVLYGRTYRDYLIYKKLNPEKEIIQIDTVCGKLTDRKRLLTIHFPKYRFMFGYLFENINPEKVVFFFEDLFRIIGEKANKMFQIILTDNGVEMDDLAQLEIDRETGEVRDLKVFYCDPYRSNQKGSIERNHEFIRYIIEKGISLDSYSQNDFNKIFSHVNSYKRAVMEFKRPIDLVIERFGFQFISKIGLEVVDPTQVILKPDKLFTK